MFSSPPNIWRYLYEYAIVRPVSLKRTVEVTSHWWKVNGDTSVCPTEAAGDYGPVGNNAEGQ